MIDWIFWTGVELLKQIAAYTGMTYQEVNVWLFIVIHPAITAVLLLLLLRRRFVR
jgi:uncharacterized membrane protein YjdF